MLIFFNCVKFFTAFLIALRKNYKKTSIYSCNTVLTETPDMWEQRNL